jgi:hypothetical protein
MSQRASHHSRGRSSVANRARPGFGLEEVIAVNWSELAAKLRSIRGSASISTPFPRSAASNPGRIERSDAGANQKTS